jgi:hypothetical protein
MEVEIDVKVHMEFNGTHWVIFVNGVPLNTRFSDKKTASIMNGFLRSNIKRIAEGFSVGMEK